MLKSGFKSLYVKFSEQYNVPHQLFFKQHKVREESDDRPSDLTLLVCNIPPYYTQDALKNLFVSCGHVKSVYFANTRSPGDIVETESKKDVFDCVKDVLGYKVAYVVFQSAKSLQKALAWKANKPVVLCNENFFIVTGLRKWCEDYNNSFEDPIEIQKEIDQFMKTYDEKVLSKEKLLKEAEAKDEEGWMTVTKKGKNPGFARKKSVKENINKIVRKKRRRKELLNFYSFQIRESKINHLCQLREKFEKDKKKIEKLKGARRFRPFS